jgi:MtrB/PioB family decaheme-associated outer membrane protein
MRYERHGGSAAAGTALQRALSLCLAVAGIALIGPRAGAQAPDTSNWNCEYCPFEQGHRGDYEPTAGAVSDDSAFFDNATGLGRDGVFVNVDGEGGFAAENHRVDWTLEDLGLDSRFAEVDGGRPGRFDYNLSWRQIPFREFFTTESIFREAAGDSLILPGDWVRAGTTDGFTQLEPSLRPRNIQSDRSILNLGGGYRPAERLHLTANYRRQRQQGNNILGGSSFTNASLLPMTFDYVTDEVDLGIRYGAGAGYVSLGWYLSDFSSDGSAFTWESPFTTAPGAEVSQLAQPPDNQFQQLTLSGGYTFAEVNTSVSVSASLGRIQQDAAFLGYTTNPNLAPPALPRASLDGQVDTRSVAFSVTSRPIRRGRVNLSWRYDERDNGTPVDVYERVITDTFLSGDEEMNFPYSYERSVLTLSGHLDVLDPVRLFAGYERRDLDRTLQEVAEQTEDKGWGGVRWQPGQVFQAELSGGVAQREIDAYNTDLAQSFGQNPLLRKYNLAYRYRTFGEFRLSATPVNVPVAVTVTGMLADDDYSQSRLGLIAARDMRLAGDVSWTFSETGSLFVNGGVEQIESEQLGSAAVAEADWRANNDDRFVTYGGGLRINELAQRYDLEFSYMRSDGTSQIAVDDFTDPGVSRFPDLETTLDYVRLGLTYRRNERLSLSADVRYQRFKAQDWALQDVGPAAIREVLSLGAEPYDDDIVVVGFSASYALAPPSPLD